MTKILYYNYVNFWQEKGGGGVSIYQKNLLDHFCKRDDFNVSFLSAGTRYNLTTKKVYIRRSLTQYPGCKCYELINSPVIAPAWKAFNNLTNFFNKDDKRVLNTLIDFIKKQGGYDILHFNNIEGLPLNVLEIKKAFPNMKIVFSLHNYVFFCPTAQLFHNRRFCVCDTKDRWNDCQNCYVMQPITKKELIKNCEGIVPTKLLSSIFKKICRTFFYKKNPIPYSPTMVTPRELIDNYPQLIVEEANKYVDVFISVSRRVKEIATSYGIDESRNKVLYIGTKFAEIQEGKQKYAPSKDKLTAAYLGYARIDKGFYFLLEGLRQLPPEQASKLHIKLCAAGLPAHDADEIRSLAPKFAGVDIINGFTHENLPEVLKDVNLGIVPVVWEDNLPQVAIEMVSQGIPILCSSAGGASELSTAEHFKFMANSIPDFLDKFKYFLDHPDTVYSYWEGHDKLKTMKEHAQELLDVYKS
ncbi:MAG: glycosyltransferase [Akkermansia sp.]|nr:glycosyltransferase [Akkermansia sp.]